jgi:hypothetical protein
MVRKSLKTMATKIWSIFCLALLAIWEARANELELSSLSNDNQFPLVGLGVGNLAHESIAAMIGAQISDRVNVTYSYEMHSLGLSRTSLGSHELVLGIMLSNFLEK